MIFVIDISLRQSHWSMVARYWHWLLLFDGFSPDLSLFPSMATYSPVLYDSCLPENAYAEYVFLNSTIVVCLIYCSQELLTKVATS